MSTDHLERQQLGMSVAGSHQLVHAIRMTVEADPEEVCLKMDFHNAHTSVSRRAVGDSLLAAPTLRHLAWPPACVLVSATALDSGDSWQAVGLGSSQRANPGGPRDRCLLQYGHPGGRGRFLTTDWPPMGGWPGSAMTIDMQWAGRSTSSLPSPPLPWPWRMVLSKAGPQQVRFVPPEWNPA